MAKVIHTPVIGRGARRALPVERTEAVDEKPSTVVRPEATTAMPSAVMIDAREAKRITAECAEAQQRAATAEAGLSEMQCDIEALRAAAKEKGFEAGKGEALRIAAEQRDADTEQFKELCGELLEQQRQRVSGAEEAAVEIGFAAVAKLLGRLHSDDALLGALVRQSMEHVLARDGLKVYVSPRDCERLQALASRDDQDWFGVEFHSDGRIEMGGCRIESRAGTLDARLERQVDELRKVLLRAAQSNGQAGTDDD